LIEDLTHSSSSDALESVYRLYSDPDEIIELFDPDLDFLDPELDPAPPRPHRTLQWRTRLSKVRRPCGYYLLSRIGVCVAVLVTKWLFPKFRALTTLGSIWDGRWYLEIARHGYPHRLYNEGDGSRWAFFPAFPAVIRGVATVTRLSYPDAAVLAAFVFGLTSAVAIWLAVREVFGTDIADRSVLLYVFFPAAYVLSMAYTEGLFLTAAAACLFALSRRYWITAALFAVLASLTRNFGVFLILCVIVAAVPVIWKEHKVRPLVAIAIAPAGLLAFMAYAWRMVGTPFANMAAEHFWQGAHFIWFESALVSLHDLVVHGVNALTNPSVVTSVGALLFAYLGVALLVRMHRSGMGMPLSWWMFTIGTVLTAFSPFFPNSILRYTMAAFPLFVAFAWKLKPAWQGAVVGCMAVAQGALTIIVLIEIVHPLPMPFYP
jgi:hypothetical protein